MIDVYFIFVIECQDPLALLSLSHWNSLMKTVSLRNWLRKTQDSKRKSCALDF